MNVDWQETIDPPCFWICMEEGEERHIAPFPVEIDQVRIDPTTTMAVDTFREALVKKYGPASFTQKVEEK